MIEKRDKKGSIVGYSIGRNIIIHLRLSDPESWFVTIRVFRIFGQSLCKKTCNKAEIARYINVLLHEKLVILDKLVKELLPFT
jgi:hypothetical protein